MVGEVCDKLRDGRFVTLLGPGGIGKTTIACAVGRAAAEDYGVVLDETTGLVDVDRTARRRAEPRPALRMFHRNGYFGPPAVS